MRPETPPITIRRATVADAAAFARVNGDPEVLPNLLQVPYPSEEFWKQRLGEILAPGKPDILLVAQCPDADGQPKVVGNAGLMSPGAALRRRHVMNLGIAIASEAQGKGVGSALMKALCDWADHWGQVLRIELTVFTDNARAIALYRRFGFEQEGVHRGYALRDGRYADTYSMARLHPAPPRIGAAA
jgi:L-phenylalanine/L-methionine N-acetyltransferase